MADILEPEDKDKLYENLLVGQSKVSERGLVKRSICSYVTVRHRGHYQAMVFIG